MVFKDSNLMETKKTIESLSKALRSHRGVGVQGSLSQLSSCLTLLDISPPTTKTLQKLSGFLRHTLKPLYIHSSTLALQCSAGFLQAIIDEKIPAAEGDKQADIVRAWETVTNSLLSGVIDYLEEHPTFEGKSAVAAHLFSKLCDRYFPQSPLSIQGASLDLLCTVYVLLSETVGSHPENQSKLRDPKFLGGKRIGVMLSQSRDYLAIEALLQLFASLLPSVQRNGAGPDKRGLFVASVFDTTLFSCGEEVKELLSSGSTTDWDATSLEIINILAKKSLAFPQPFAVVGLTVCGTALAVADRLYLDNKGFTLNIDENGAYDTLHAPSATVQNIKFSDVSSSATTVTVRLASPPTVGKAPFAPSINSGAIDMIFDITKAEVKRFVRSLRERQLDEFVTRKERKMSKSDAQLTLDFDTNGKTFQFQDKVKHVYAFTSPITHIDPRELSSTTPNQPARSPSVIETTMKPASSKTNMTPPEAVILAESDDENESIPVKVKKGKTGNKKKMIVESEDEEIEDIPVAKQSARPIHPTAPAKDSRTSKAAANPSTKSTGKRKAVDVPGTAADAPPAKRTRAAKTDTVDVKSLPSARQSSTIFPRSPKTTKRYGKKNRTSSPTPDEDIDDFDNIPIPSTDMRSDVKASAKTEVQVEARPTRAAAMKSKAGKPAAGANKSKAAKDAGVKTRQGNLRNAPVEAHLSSDDHDVPQNHNTKPNSRPNVTEEHEDGNSADEPRATRRSARGANPVPVPKNNANTTTATAKAKKEKPTAAKTTHGKKVKVVFSDPVESEDEMDDAPVRSDKAPWEDMHLVDKSEVVAEHTDDTTTNMTTDEATSLSESDAYVPETYQDYTMPIKTGSTPPPDQDVTMIDLTQDEDDSPPKARTKNRSRAEKVATAPRLSTRTNHDTTKTLPLDPKPETIDLQSPVVVKKRPTPTAKPTCAPGTERRSSIKSLDFQSLPTEQKRIPPTLKPAPVPTTEQRRSVKPLEDQAPILAPEQKRAPPPLKPASAPNSERRRSVEPLDSDDQPPTIENKKPTPSTKPVPANVLSDERRPIKPIPKPAATTRELKNTPSITEIERPNVAVNMQSSKPKPTGGRGSSTFLEHAPAIKPTIKPTSSATRTSPSAYRDVNSGTEPATTPQRPMELPDPPRRPARSGQHAHPNVTFDAPSKSPNAPVESRVPYTFGRHSSSPKFSERKGRRSTGDLSFFRKYKDEDDSFYSHDGSNSSRGIVEILGDIQDVLVDKISRRFDHVKNDVRYGRDNFLRAASADMEKMRIETATYFNSFIDLETEYASSRRGMVDDFDDTLKANKDIARQITQIVQEHDRHSLSKKFPKSLLAFPAALAA